MTQETLKKLEEVFAKVRCTSNGSSNVDRSIKIESSGDPHESQDGILHASTGSGHICLIINDEKFEIFEEDVDAIIKYSQSNTGSNKE